MKTVLPSVQAVGNSPQTIFTPIVPASMLQTTGTAPRTTLLRIPTDGPKDGPTGLSSDRAALMNAPREGHRSEAPDVAKGLEPTLATTPW